MNMVEQAVEENGGSNGLSVLPTCKTCPHYPVCILVKSANKMLEDVYKDDKKAMPFLAEDLAQVCKQGPKFQIWMDNSNLGAEEVDITEEI